MKRVNFMAKKKHTRIITEPDGTKVELDYSFKAFWEAIINNPPEKAAASIRRSRNAKKRAKIRKRNRRKARTVVVARHCNKALNEFVFGK